MRCGSRTKQPKSTRPGALHPVRGETARGERSAGKPPDEDIDIQLPSNKE